MTVSDGQPNWDQLLRQNEELLRWDEERIQKYEDQNLPDDGIFQSVFGRPPITEDDRYLKIALKVLGIDLVRDHLADGESPQYAIDSLIEQFRDFDEWNRRCLEMSRERLADVKLAAEAARLHRIIDDPTASPNERARAKSHLHAMWDEADKQRDERRNQAQMRADEPD